MFPAQRHFFAWAENCQESNPGLLWNFQQPWPTSQTLRWKNAIFYGYKTIVFCRKVNFHFPMVEIPVPYIFSPKTQSVNLFCFSILLLTSVLSLVIYSQQLRKSKSSNSDLFLSKAQKQDFRRKLWFSFHQMFHKCLSIMVITDQ